MSENEKYKEKFLKSESERKELALLLEKSLDLLQGGELVFKLFSETINTTNELINFLHDNMGENADWPIQVSKDCSLEFKLLLNKLENSLEKLNNKKQELLNE